MQGLKKEKNKIEKKRIRERKGYKANENKKWEGWRRQQQVRIYPNPTQGWPTCNGAMHEEHSQIFAIGLVPGEWWVGSLSMQSVILTLISSHPELSQEFPISQDFSSKLIFNWL